MKLIYELEIKEVANFPNQYKYVIHITTPDYDSTIVSDIFRYEIDCIKVGKEELIKLINQ